MVKENTGWRDEDPMVAEWGNDSVVLDDYGHGLYYTDDSTTTF